ncbi:MAG: M23 family metallopeptidase [Patescibacteria group bacterium]
MPLRWVVRTALPGVARPLYRVYRLTRSSLNRVLAPAKNRWAYFLLHRNTMTGVIAVIALLIGFNNVQARGQQSDTIGQHSLFASFFPTDLSEDVEVVEGAVAPASHEDKLALTPTTQQARPNTGTTVDPGNAEERQLALGIGGAGEEQNEDVRYYIVEGGDTLSTIAQQFGISTTTIQWENNLSDTDFIKPGQKLTILPVDGVTHTVKKGDTVDAIAKKYKAEGEKILSFNRLASTEALNEGEELIVPGGVVESAAPRQQPQNPSSASRRIAIFNIPPPARSTTGKRLQWPAPSRRVNQYFRFRHTGIDIDGNVGQPIYAADSGVVESVTYARYGYGFHVVINHGGGRETLYAHASRIFVRPGQSVKRGQSIAVIGLTGRTTGAHLHFEVIQNGAKRNPLSYL